MKTIFGKKGLLIGSIALLVILIQVVSGGMGSDIALGEPPFRYYFPKIFIGLDIAPGNVEIEQGSTVDYNITIYNYQSRLDCFVITVIPESCDPNWFDWRQNEVYIPRYGAGRISLNVTPDEVGYFRFKVIVSGNGLEASQRVWITANLGPVDMPEIINQPPVEPCLSYPTPNGVPKLAAGTAIKLNGFAVDPDGDTLYYRYWLKGPSTEHTWKIMRDWNAANTWTWHTTAADIGDNDISVWIRDGHHAGANGYDLEITVYSYKIVADPTEPQPTDEIIWDAEDSSEEYWEFWWMLERP